MGEFDVTVRIDVVVDMASEKGGWVGDWREREGWQRGGRRGREEGYVFVGGEEWIWCIDGHVFVKNGCHSS